MRNGVFGKITRWLRDHRLALISLLVFLIFVFGYLGLDKLYNSTPSVPRTIPDRVYGIFQIIRIAPGLTINNPTWELEITRWLAILLIGYSAFIVVADHFSRETGLLSLKIGRGHVVICGSGALAVFLAQKYAGEGTGVVMIVRSSEDKFQPPEDVIFLRGDRPGQLLKDAQLARAGRLLCVEDDDALNADLLGHACEVIGEDTPGRPEILVHIVDPVLCNLIKAKLFRLSHK